MSEGGIGAGGAATGVGDLEHIGVGMLGYAFMGKAHSNALRTLAYMTWPPPYLPDLVAMAGRNEAAVTEAARRYGFERAVFDWRDLVADPRVQVFDNVAPNNLHGEPTIAAAEAGKHVICEKPLGRDADESYEIWQRTKAAGVKHLCAFNYRFVPAVRLAREMIEAGDARRDPPLPRQLPAGLDRGPEHAGELAAAGRRRGLRRAGRHRRARHRPRPLPRRRDRVGERADQDVRRRPARRPGERRRRVRVDRRVRARRGRDDRGLALRARAQERADLGDQRVQGLDPLRPRAPQRAAGAPRVHDAGRARAGLPHRARLRARPPLLAALVAAGSHHRVGAHLRARAGTTS